MQRTRVAFWLYLVENGINVVLAVALVHPMGVRGLALSLSVAYTRRAPCAAWPCCRGWLGTLGEPGTWAPLRRGAVATVVMGAVVLVVSNLSGADQGVGLLVRVVASVVAGIVVYVGASALLDGGRPAGAGARAGAGTGARPPGGGQPDGPAPSRTRGRRCGDPGPALWSGCRISSPGTDRGTRRTMARRHGS